MKKPVATSKACGKFILLGEHFVVHKDVPALAFPLRDLWCEVKISLDSFPHYKAQFPAGEVQELVENLMSRAAQVAADSMRMDLKSQPLFIESKANFSISRGLGSSAAFSVALARSFDEYRKSITGEYADLGELQKTCIALERLFHGKTSGLDVAVVMAATPIRFQNGEIRREVNNTAADFVIVDSGNRENCAPLVERIGKVREENPAHWEKLETATTAMVDQCEKELSDGNAQAVGKIAREAHGVLSELGLSTPTIESILATAQKLGSLGGKVSGAGAGGAVVLVAPLGEGRKLADRLKEQKLHVVAVESPTENLRKNNGANKL